MSNFGVISKGVVCPIIREGDNIVDIVVDSLLNATIITGGRSTDPNDTAAKRGAEFASESFDIHEHDIIGITESVVARSFGEYITVDDIAEDVRKKYGKDATIAVVNPIYSRNRFAMILKGIARAAKKIVLVLPQCDEVGNPSGVNPFTGVDIQQYYIDLCTSENCDATVVAGACEEKNVLYCGLHDYQSYRGKKGLNGQEDSNAKKDSNGQEATNETKGSNGQILYTLEDICSDACPDWGVLGTNKSTEERLKLFPSREHVNDVCLGIKKIIKEKTGKNVYPFIFGDGCFRSPYLYTEKGDAISGSSIWEEADPVTYMSAYEDAALFDSTPNEIKLKSLIDGSKSDADVEKELRQKKADLKGQMASMGTTPRRYGDLLASLCDLMVGSGDRACPVTIISGYFRF